MRLVESSAQIEMWVATEVTGVIANLHWTAGPVEMRHRMIGKVAGVLQLVLEGDRVSLIWHNMHSPMRDPVLSIR